MKSNLEVLPSAGRAEDNLIYKVAKTVDTRYHEMIETR